MGSVEMEIFVDNADETLLKSSRCDEAVSDTAHGEVSFVASHSSLCSEKASAKAYDCTDVVPLSDNCEREPSLTVIPVEQSGLDHCHILPERPIGRISPIDGRNAEPIVPSAAATETGSGINQSATGGRKFQPFLPRRMTHRRHDSVSGEIPMQGQQLCNEARNDRTYDYDQEVPSFPSRGRPRHRQQYEQPAVHQDHHGPGQNQDRDVDWQGMGTVYASEETYSFRYFILYTIYRHSS